MNKKIRNAQLAQYNFIFGEYFNMVASCKCVFSDVPTTRHDIAVTWFLILFLFCYFVTCQHRLLQCSAQVFKRAGCHLKRAHLSR